MLCRHSLFWQIVSLALICWDSHECQEQTNHLIPILRTRPAIGQGPKALSLALVSSASEELHVGPAHASCSLSMESVCPDFPLSPTSFRSTFFGPVLTWINIEKHTTESLICIKHSLVTLSQSWCRFAGLKFCTVTIMPMLPLQYLILNLSYETMGWTFILISELESSSSITISFPSPLYFKHYLFYHEENGKKSRYLQHWICDISFHIKFKIWLCS